LFLREFAVHDPGTLVAMFTVDQRNPNLLFTSYPNYREFRDQNTVFSSLMLYIPVTITLTGRGDPRLIMAHLVTGNYFDTLGVRPSPGRAFLPEEDPGGTGPDVAVISYGLWQRIYGGDPRITQRTIGLNGHSFAIVGVTPKEFNGLNQLFGADVYVPMSTYQHTFPVPALVASRRTLMFPVVGRLKQGIGPAQAQAALQGVAEDLEREYPRENQGRRIKLTT